MSEPDFEQSGEENQIEIGENILLSGWVRGNRNRVLIGAARMPQKVWLQIHGDDNLVRIGAQPVLNGLRIEFGNPKYMTWDGALIIGDGFSIASRGRFLLPNPHNRVEIGVDCMLSNEIVIRGGEYPHLIFERGTGKYLDFSDGIFIGDHVWIGEGAYINKAVTIPANCIVGARSVVTKRFSESHTVIAGNPARVVKQNIEWVMNERKLPADGPHRKSLDATRRKKPPETGTTSGPQTMLKPHFGKGED